MIVYAKNIIEAKLLAKVTNDPNLEVLKADLSKYKYKKFNLYLHKINQRFPLDYILQDVRFANLQFFVNQDVLIPREETQWWIEQLIETNNLKEKPMDRTILVDLGSGSGLIGITLASYFKQVYLLDKSKKALRVSKINCDKNQTKNTITLQSDLLNIFNQKNISLENWVLVANLPYLPESDINSKIDNKVEYEPKQALYCKQNGLFLAKKLIRQLKKRFKGALPIQIWLELDPRNIDDFRNYCEMQITEYSCNILKDLNYQNRVIVLKLK